MAKVKKRSLMSMANLVVADWQKEKIKDWYTKNHPTDDMGEKLNDKVTFADLMNALNNKKEIYKIMGVGDSVIRERLFERLSQIYGVSYDDIYKKWLESDYYAKGGSVGGKEPFYMKLNKAENNWSKDNGAEYKRLLKERDFHNSSEFSIKLGEAENKWKKDNGAEYKRLLKLQDWYNGEDNGGGEKKGFEYSIGGL
jgi:hypothetical protein